MLLLISYAYSQKLSGQPSDDAIIEIAEEKRREIVNSMNSMIIGQGYDYSPAYHIIANTLTPDTIHITAAELVGSKEFIPASEKNRLVRLIGDVLSKISDIIVDSESFEYSRGMKDISEMVFVSDFISARLSNIENVIETVNDYTSPYNPYTTGAEGTPVIVLAETDYPDA